MTTASYRPCSGHHYGSASAVQETIDFVAHAHGCVCVLCVLVKVKVCCLL
jgi:hypothetical protein